MQPSNFDELTKALASSPSRRHALKVIATASVGGMFGLVGIRNVFGANKNCAQWCAQVFGPNTSAAGRCTSDAAKGKGICQQCGNKPPSSICCVRNTSGYCNGTSTATCCASGQHCCSGTCSQCCSNSDCSNGNTCGASHTCVCGSGAACTGDTTCIAGSCCPNSRVCGNTCCSSSQSCNNGTCCIANNGSCTSDADCCSTHCDLTTMTCVSCVPSGDGCSGNDDCCSDNTCLNNLCCPTANVCGSTCCPSGQHCSNGQCVANCTPNCTGKNCGDDGCGGSCGSCSTGDTCLNGGCCTPNCTGKNCGDNGCGGSCGTPCSTGQTCINGGCCTENPGSCTANSECCSGLCAAGTCATCVSSGGTCTLSTQCCSGNCSNGICCDSGWFGCHSTCCIFGQSCGQFGCVGSSGCFVAGTPVVMAGGYHQSIDRIRVGDTILAWNEDTKQIFPTTVVEALHHEETMQTLFDIELEDRRKFTVNDNHRMYVAEDERFIVSRELPGRVGNGKPVTFLDNNNVPVKLASLRTRTERCKVYNLHVKGQGEKGHTYFANGIVVHNAKGD